MGGGWQAVRGLVTASGLTYVKLLLPSGFGAVTFLKHMNEGSTSVHLVYHGSAFYCQNTSVWEIFQNQRIFTFVQDAWWPSWSY